MVNQMNQVDQIINRSKMDDFAMARNTPEENRGLFKEIQNFFDSKASYDVYRYNDDGLSMINSGPIEFVNNQTIEGHDTQYDVNKLEIQLGRDKIQEFMDIFPFMDGAPTMLGHDSKTGAVLLKTNKYDTMVYVPNGEQSNVYLSNNDVLDNLCTYSERE